MAFEIRHNDFYQCLSTETKETAGVKAGSRCEETDTGLEFIFDGTNWNKKVVTSTLNGSLAKADKATNADATDRTIDATSAGGFTKVSLDCSQCTSEMVFTIDEAILASTKKIYVAAGSVFSDNLSGNILHYSGAGTFYYALSK